MLFSHISLKPISKDDIIPEIELPGMSVETEKSDDNDDDIAEPNYVSPDQLDADLITMSTVAQSRWQNLLDIDIIKQRNKPKQALKVPEAAPFFLPTIPSLNLRFDLSHFKMNENTEKQGLNSGLHNVTLFSKSLELTLTTDDFSVVVEMLKTMSPSAIDFEVQALSLDEISSESLLLQFMKMIRFMMEQHVDFELSQAYLAVFLKWHGTTLTEQNKLRDYLRVIQEVQKRNWHILRDKLFYNISIVQNLKKCNINR